MNRSRTRTALAVCALAGLLTAGCGNEPRTAENASADGAPSTQQKESGTADGPDATSEPDTTSEPDNSADTPPAAQQDAAARPAWCTTAALDVSLRQLHPAAGNRYTALVLTNTSGSACRTQGYPGLQLVTADGRDLPTTVVRDRARTPTQLTLRPGATAWARLHWSQVPGEGDSSTGPCQGTPAELEVIPPDQRTHTDVRWRSGEVCSSGRISVLPLAAGAGPAD